MRSRPGALAVAALALLGAAVVASGAGGGTAGEQRLRLPGVGPLAWSLLLLALLAGVLMAAAAFRRGPRPQTPRRSPMRQLLPVLLTVLALAVWAMQRRPEDRAVEGDPDTGAPLGGAAGDVPPAAESGELVLVLVLLVAGVAAAAFAARRRARPPDPTVAGEMGALLDDLALDVEADLDPRRAVIRAYQRLERALAPHGLGRRPAEAPREYLRRVLVDLRPGPAPAAAGRLTDLFERAMFSPHQIDEAMRSEAVAALRSVASELQADPVGPPAPAAVP